MLPETLLVKRPVSAMRIDGTYREDFLEGGKNAKDRRYPIMFLALMNCEFRKMQTSREGCIVCY